MELLIFNSRKDKLKDWVSINENGRIEYITKEHYGSGKYNYRKWTWTTKNSKERLIENVNQIRWDHPTEDFLILNAALEATMLDEEENLHDRSE